MKANEFLTEADMILLENKAQYKQMMQPLIDNGIWPEQQVTKVINTARQLLKRNDRIAWYLKWMRLYAINDHMSDLLQQHMNAKGDDQRQAEIQAVADGFNKMIKKWQKQVYVPGSDWLGQVKRFSATFGNHGNLEHFASMWDEVPQMDKIVWTEYEPVGLFNALNKAEQEWRENRKQHIDMSNDAGWEKVIDYGDTAWVLLDREYCDLEGDAMGHCGNRGSPKDGDRILSFRSIKNESHKPHLTFILDRNNRLGEMKGRANEKPAEKYHKVIIDLLLSDIVKGIKGGGYMPQNNFELDDLDPDVKEQLFQKKPALMSLRDRIRAGHELDADEFQGIMERFYESDVVMNPDDFHVDLETKSISVRKFDETGEIAEWAEKYDLTTLMNIARAIHDGDAYEYVGDYISEYDTEAMSDSLAHMVAGKAFIRTVETILENEDVEIYDEMSSVNDAIEMAQAHDEYEEMEYLLYGVRHAIQDGMMYGIENEMFNEMNKTLEENNIIDNEAGGWIWRIGLEKAMELYQELEEDDGYYTDEVVEQMLDLQDASEPYNGWSDFDADGAAENFADRVAEESSLFNDIYLTMAKKEYGEPNK